jgi:hypothetical protein
MALTIYVAIKNVRSGRLTLEQAGRSLMSGEIYMARMSDLAVLRRLYPSAEDRTAPPVGQAGDHEHGAGYLPTPGPEARR